MSVDCFLPDSLSPNAFVIFGVCDLLINRITPPETPINWLPFPLHLRSLYLPVVVRMASFSRRLNSSREFGPRRGLKV